MYAMGGSLSPLRVTTATLGAYNRSPVLPFTVPGLWSYPLPFPVHLSGRGRGGAQKGGVGVSGATDIPRLGQITEAASFQELELPVLTPCPTPEGGTAGLNAHCIKKTQTTERTVVLNVVM